MEVKMFIGPMGIILGQFEERDEFGGYKIKEPLNMQPTGDGEARFAPILTAVEWIVLPASYAEVECQKGYQEAYTEARQGIFTSIISPTAQERAKILGA